MFALIAAVLWFLTAVGITSLGPVSLVWLGACLLALHLAVGWPVPWPSRR